jgi:hypothetical protein
MSAIERGPDSAVADPAANPRSSAPRAVMLPAVPDLAARLTALSAPLRRACEAELRPDDPRVLFHLLTRDIHRRLRDGDHAPLAEIFAEVERALADPPLADAAARLLEDLPSPELHVHALPWLGPRSLATLRAWETRDPYLSPAQADALLAPLRAASSIFARGWPKAAPHVCAADGTTTTHGIADFTFEVLRTSLGPHDPTERAALLAALDPLLAPADRALARAFERCCLERLRELSLAVLKNLRPLMGPHARAYCDVHLALGEPRFGAWDESSEPRLLPTTTLRRDAAWGWRVTMPRGDLGNTIQEALVHDGRLVGRDDTAIDDTDVSARWTWGDEDPPGDYVFHLRLGELPFARFAFTLL